MIEPEFMIFINLLNLSPSSIRVIICPKNSRFRNTLTLTNENFII